MDMQIQYLTDNKGKKTAVLVPFKEWEKFINDYKYLQKKIGLNHSVKEIQHKNFNYTAITKKDGNCWIGWIEEIPGVNCQESTREELLESLKITLKEALEFNKKDAISTAGEGFSEEPIAL